MKKPVFLKILMLLIALVLAVALFSCINTPDHDPPPPCDSNGNGNGSYIDIFNINIVPSANGRVTASATSASENDLIVLNITADVGYKLSGVRVNNGYIAGNSFVMPARDVSVSTLFIKIDDVVRHPVTVKSPNGTVFLEPLQSDIDQRGLFAGVYVHVKAVADSGFVLTSLTAGGENITTFFLMPERAIEIVATFLPINNEVTFNLNIKESEKGELFVNSGLKNDSFSFGASVNFEVVPQGGYALDAVFANGQFVNYVNFTMPAHDVEIEAVFIKTATPKPFKIEPFVGENIVAYASPALAAPGDSVRVFVLPASGFMLNPALPWHTNLNLPNGATVDGFYINFCPDMPPAEQTIKLNARNPEPALRLNLSLSLNFNPSHGTVTAHSASPVIRHNALINLVIRENAGFLLKNIYYIANDGNKISLAPSFYMPNGSLLGEDRTFVVYVEFEPMLSAECAMRNGGVNLLNTVTGLNNQFGLNLTAFLPYLTGAVLLENTNQVYVFELNQKTALLAMANLLDGYLKTSPVGKIGVFTLILEGRFIVSLGGSTVFSN
jgi:hypothetical protein